MSRQLPRLRLHRPSVVGRARADLGALVLVAVVVALVTVLTSAVPPVAERTADRAVADAVRRAGTAGDVVGQAPFDEEDPSGDRVRDPLSAQEVGRQAAVAQLQMSRELAQVLRPAVAT